MRGWRRLRDTGSGPTWAQANEQWAFDKLTVQQAGRLLRGTPALNAGTQPVDLIATFEATELADRFELLRSLGADFARMQSAGLGIGWARAAGAQAPADMRCVGIDALSLHTPRTLEQMIDTYGAAEVAAEFLRCEASAVDIVGLPSQRLGIPAEELLRHCRNSRAHAMAVVEVLKETHQDPLASVCIDVIVASGLSAADLKALGWSLVRLAHEKGATQDQLHAIGFVLAL